MGLKAFGYIRVSGLGQVKGHGPKRQREDIVEYARQNQVEIAGWYEDSHTGTEADRPQFMAMLATMMANGVKTVVVASLDRFARDLQIQCLLLAKLAAEGLTLIAANTGEDVTAAMKYDPMRKALVQIQGVLSELDKSQTVAKLRRAREAVRSLGKRCEGRKPYGFYPGEQDVLDRIRRLHRKPRMGERLPVSRVAAMLNAEGLHNRSGGPWTGAHVRQLLRSGALTRPKAAELSAD